ncbi:MAG: hypothetical protein [Circoviridae sp.]|nr:MAG: hypothetical protein [Circoviridae sp.]
MAKYFSRKKSYSRRKKSLARIGRKTVRRARSRRRWNKAMPNLRHSIVIPVRQRVSLQFPNAGADTFTLAIQRFKSGTAAGLYSYAA